MNIGKPKFDVKQTTKLKRKTKEEDNDRKNGGQRILYGEEFRK